MKAVLFMLWQSFLNVSKESHFFLYLRSALCYNTVTKKRRTGRSKECAAVMSGPIEIHRRTEQREIQEEQCTILQPLIQELRERQQQEAGQVQTLYQQFMGRLTALPENVPVAEGAPIREEQTVRKERKRREKEAKREYREQGKRGRLLFLEEGRGLKILQNGDSLKKWGDARTKHIEVYMILPEQAERVKPLLSREAVDLVSRGQAFSLCAVEDSEVCGAVCARFSQGREDAVEWISFYVAPSHRRRGIGGTLLLELLDELMDFTGGELCRMEVVFSETAEGIAELLQVAGFSLETEKTACAWRISVAALADAPLLQRNPSFPQGLFSLESLDHYQKKQIYHNLKRYDADYLSMEELAHAHPKLSYVLMGTGNSLDACSILDTQEEGVYCLRQFFCTRNHTTAALPVLQASARALLAFCPGEAVLEIPTVTEAAVQLVRHLLPKETICRHMVHAVLDLHERKGLLHGLFDCREQKQREE